MFALLDDNVIEAALSFLFFCSGLCLGSFATAIIYREKNGISWFDLKGKNIRSSCPACGHTLGFSDLIPLFSWIVLRGRCRFCRSAIPAFYPRIEAVTAVTAVALYLAAGIGHILFAGLGLLPFIVSMVYLAVFDKLWSWRLLVIVVFIISAAFLLPHFQSP